MIESVIVGTNADIMLAAAELYIEPDDIVVDVTYGRGAFWRKLPGLPTVAHDLYRGDGIDLRALPEQTSSVDVVVLDPPYRPDERTPNEHGRGPDFEDRFGLGEGLTDPRAILELYRAGIAEAERVLRPRGRLLLKCQDAINGRAFETMLLDIVDIARDEGLDVLDIFVLYYGRNTGPGSGRWERQQRSRRAHSFLVVFARSRFWERRNSRAPIPRGPEGTLELELDA